MTTVAAQDAEDDFELDFEDENEENGAKIEIVDDTPPADRGREPMPKEIVDEFEADELEEYSDKVKTRLKQAKKLYHDERREKERALRENTEAMAAAARLLEENKRLKGTLSQGETVLLDSFKQSAGFEVEAAKRAYKEAHETGDPDKLVEASEALNNAIFKARQLDTYKSASQPDNNVVEESSQASQTPRPDAKAVAWQERNTWYGSDPEMTASALGLHQKLVQERGAAYAGSDEYWAHVDTTMKRRFPEYFGESEKPDGKAASQREPNPAVVAPASRSRSPKKIVLRQSQLAIAKKLGLTPEQYARELMKLENN